MVTSNASASARAGTAGLRWFDSELKMLPGVNLPLRSLYVSGGSGSALISPVMTAEEQAEVGAVEALLAPSLLHHVTLSAALKQYGAPTLWGPPRFAQRNRAFHGARVFGVDPWPYAPELEFEVVQGAPMRNEVVFFHRASRSIYTADLVFNLQQPVGLLTSLPLRLMGIHRRFAAPRPWRFWVVNRPAFQRSLQRILAWDFDRIVVAHGDVLERGGRSGLEGAFKERGLL